MPALAMVEMALLYQAPAATSVKLLLWLQYAFRLSSVSIRKKMVATSARVIFPWGFTGFLSWSSVGSPVA